ncbi:LysE family translocator [Acetobacter okinawensis]|uniref:LysE family translocator n=1 Tax=Acetobacter okinawensis TaxID=1076594 RepID=UPI00209D0243|nr:LysE family translocator [Acetobacter okinawensis]MCP1213300.1 LysE family translocator [Acetobacter okinawensis]
MIDLPLLLAFTLAASVLTITPGVDTALVLRTATVDGQRPAILAASGIALGCLIWGAAVSFGLGTVLRASALAYTMLKFAGALYLIWLGGKLLFKPRTTLQTESCSHSPKGSSAFLRGFLTDLLNPKMGVFYITFLPQFVPAGASVARYSFFLACLHVVITLIWFAVLITATASLSRFLRQPRAVQILDRMTGFVFIAFGLKLATSRIP